MLPTPDATAQVKVGCVVIAAPNWSFAVAENCSVAPEPIAAGEGLTATLVKVWFTVTLTALVVD